MIAIAGWIRTMIVGVEGVDAGHQTTTTTLIFSKCDFIFLDFKSGFRDDKFSFSEILTKFEFVGNS